MFRKISFTALIGSVFLIGCQTADDTEQTLPKEETEIAIDETPIKKQEDKKEDITAPDLPKEHLQKFDSGSSVKQLNEYLITLGYQVDDASDFNILTTWALTDIQLQLTKDNVTGMYDQSTQTVLNTLKNDETTITPGSALAKPKVTNDLSEVIENPYDILALVNKQYALPNDYIPNDLVVPNVRFPFTEDDPKKQLRKVAADALEDLFEAADKADLELFAQSGYRSYDRQETIFNNNIARHGEEHANTFSARPGQSEHQTGLVMDVTNQTVGFDLIIEFGETPEGLWLKDNAHQFGFIIRYPEGKEEITQYQYEPWHLRYLGIELASELHQSGQTLDEYYK